MLDRGPRSQLSCGAALQMWSETPLHLRSPSGMHAAQLDGSIEWLPADERVTSQVRYPPAKSRGQGVPSLESRVCLLQVHISLGHSEVVMHGMYSNRVCPCPAFKAYDMYILQREGKQCLCLIAWDCQTACAN